MLSTTVDKTGYFCSHKACWSLKQQTLVGNQSPLGHLPPYFFATFQFCMPLKMLLLSPLPAFPIWTVGVPAMNHDYRTIHSGNSKGAHTCKTLGTKDQS